MYIFKSYTLTKRDGVKAPHHFLTVERRLGTGGKGEEIREIFTSLIFTERVEGGFKFSRSFRDHQPTNCKFSGAPKSSTLHTTTLRENNTCYTLTICYKGLKNRKTITKKTARNNSFLLRIYKQVLTKRKIMIMYDDDRKIFNLLHAI